MPDGQSPQVRCLIRGLIQVSVKRACQTPRHGLADWERSIGRARLVADGAGLENRYGETHRGFESHALRSITSRNNPRSRTSSRHRFEPVPVLVLEFDLRAGQVRVKETERIRSGQQLRSDYERTSGFAVQFLPWLVDDNRPGAQAIEQHGSMMLRPTNPGRLAAGAPSSVNSAQRWVRSERRRPDDKLSPGRTLIIFVSGDTLSTWLNAFKLPREHPRLPVRSQYRLLRPTRQLS